MDGLLIRRVYVSVRRMGGDEDLAREFSNEAALREDTSQLICTMAAEVAQKYNLAAEYAPEVFLGLGLITWGVQVKTVFAKLDDLAAMKRKSE